MDRVTASGRWVGCCTAIGRRFRGDQGRGAPRTLRGGGAFRQAAASCVGPIAAQRGERSGDRADGEVVHDFSPTDLRPAVDTSRRRLGLDELHGLLLHDPSPPRFESRKSTNFLSEMLTSRKAARVGASVATRRRSRSGHFDPVTYPHSGPVGVVSALLGTAILDSLRRRGVGLFVREILRSQDMGQPTHDRPPRRKPSPPPSPPISSPRRSSG